MSKFAKAVEQAERDRLLRRDREPDHRPDSYPASTLTFEAGPVVEPFPSAEVPLLSPASFGGDDMPDLRAGLDDRLVSLIAPGTFEAEQYRVLRHAVEEARRQAGRTVFAVSSPGVGDGKTTTAINLAGALAQAPGVRVLLIDADLRGASVAARIGLPGLAGPVLADLVLDPTLCLDDVARPVSPFNLAVIPAGSPSPNAYEIFKSARFGELLAEARSRFDYVILDTPPLVHVLDSRVIGRWVDAYVIVVACHRTPRKLLADALNMMEPDKIAGLVFNEDDGPLSSSTYHQYAYGRPPRRQRMEAWTSRRRSGRRSA